MAASEALDAGAAAADAALPDAGGRPTATPRPGAYANLDPDDDYVVGPPEVREHCAKELEAAGVTFKSAPIPVHTQKKSKLVCGAPEVVVFLKGPGAIQYNGAPVLTCGMALALASFERILQKEALARFASPVARIDQIGTYNCREVQAYPSTVSEHSYANAIDLTRFVLRNGRVIEVLRDFDKSETPKTPAGDFLRVVTRRANDEDVFSHVLTPFFNAAHRNHFHLDLARFRQDGTRPETPAPDRSRIPASAVHAGGAWASALYKRRSHP
jgi:hypothetical protein